MISRIFFAHLQAIKLEQRIAALKERVEAERIKKQKLQAMLMRYRDVDQDIAGLGIYLITRNSIFFSHF